MLPAQNVNIEALLAHVPLFNGLENEEIARIARGTREVNVIRGDMLFHKGDVSTGFHLIVYGQIKLGFTSAQGAEKVVDIIGQGQTFGEAVMFMDKPYPVFAQALADSRLLHVSKRVILDGIERDLDPGEPHNQNLYALSPEELKAAGIGILPQNLHEALLALENDTVLCKALGPVAPEFLRLKHMEWVEYMRHVSD